MTTKLREQALITVVWLLLWASIAVFALIGLHYQPESVPSAASESPPTPTQRGASNGLASGSPVPTAVVSTVPSEPAVVDVTPEAAKVTPVPTPTLAATSTVKPTKQPTPRPTVIDRARGRASWHHAPAGHAAAPWGYWRMKPVKVRVTLIADTTQTIEVEVTGYCQCYVGTEDERLIDLPYVDFADIASPERDGVVWVIVERLE